jgi:hypothetical protein
LRIVDPHLGVSGDAGPEREDRGEQYRPYEILLCTAVAREFPSMRPVTGGDGLI